MDDNYPPPVPGPVFELTAIGRTDVGREREVNEDAFTSDEFPGLYLVCDGMGGHASGHVAAELAVRTVVRTLKTGDPAPAEGEEPLVCAIKAANDAVYQRAQVDPDCHGMGTTAVGIRADGNYLQLCHAGDSRCYLLRRGELVQLTRDHSLVNLYEDRPDLVGTMGPATSNIIIRAIGLDPEVGVDHQTLPMVHGDLYLLCCDGLTDLVDDWMIREILTSGEPLDVIADNLVRAANANGGSDNITVITLWITDQSTTVSGELGSQGGPPPPVPPPV